MPPLSILSTNPVSLGTSDHRHISLSSHWESKHFHIPVFSLSIFPCLCPSPPSLPSPCSNATHWGRAVSISQVVWIALASSPQIYLTKTGEKRWPDSHILWSDANTQSLCPVSKGAFYSRPTYSSLSSPYPFIDIGNGHSVTLGLLNNTLPA